MPTTRGTDKQQTGRPYQEKLHLIYRYVYSYVRNQQEAEDLTTHIFLKAAHALDSIKEEHRSRAQLLQVAHKTITSYQSNRVAAISSEQVLQRDREGDVETDPSPPINEATQRVQYILQAVHARDSEVLTYRFLLNLTIKETALIMDTTEATIRILQWHALQRAADLNGLTN